MRMEIEQQHTIVWICAYLKESWVSFVEVQGIWNLTENAVSQVKNNLVVGLPSTAAGQPWLDIQDGGDQGMRLLGLSRRRQTGEGESTAMNVCACACLCVRVCAPEKIC